MSRNLCKASFMSRYLCKASFMSRYLCKASFVSSYLCKASFMSRDLCKAAFVSRCQYGIQSACFQNMRNTFQIGIIILDALSKYRFFARTFCFSVRGCCK